MAIPTVQAVGTPNNGTAAVTYVLPAHQANDILLLVVECAETGGVTAPSGGWAHITNSPRAQGANVTAINVMWLRAAGSGTTNPQVADPGNHQIGVALVIRSAITSGNPWDFSPVGDGAAGATSFSADPGTTTVADTLGVIAIAGNTDTTVDQWSSVANATLSSFTVQEQQFTDDGNGGGIGVFTGGKATTGSTGNTTGNMASQTWSALTFAIKPTTGSQDEVGTATLSGSGTLAGTQTSVTVSGTSTLSGSGTLTASGAPGPINTAALSGSGTLTAAPTTAVTVTNLLLNPSVESGTGTFLWGSANGNNTAGRNFDQGPRTGTFDFKGTVISGFPGASVWMQTSTANGGRAAVTAGLDYTASMYVKEGTGAAGFVGSAQVRIKWYNASNSQFDASSLGSAVGTSTSYVRASTTATAPVGAVTAAVEVQVTGTETTGDVMVADDALLTEGSTLYPYFDGDTTDDATNTYSWTGVAHESTSTWVSGAASPTITGATASLSGSGTLAGTQTSVTVLGTAALSGSGTLTASGAPGSQDEVGTAALSGSGTLAGTQTSVTVSGTAALSGSGSLVASGAPGPINSATLSGSGTLAGTQTAVTASGTATLSGSGTLTASGIPGPINTATLSSSGTLAASGAPGSQDETGTATLSGSGTLTAGPTALVVLTNLLRNPSSEQAGWSGTSGSVGGGSARSGSLSLVGTADGSGVFTASTNGAASSNAVVVAGNVYSAGMYATRVTGTSGTITAKFDWYNSANGLFASSSTGSPVSLLATGTFARAVIENVTAPVGATQARVTINGTGLSASAIFSADDATINDGATVYPYFDGDTTDDASNTYAWTGTPHASTSTWTTGASSPTITGATATLSGSGTLTASGGTGESHSGSASLSGSGTLAGAGLGYKNIAFDASGTTTAVNLTSSMTINIGSAAVGSMVYAWGSWGGDFSSVTATGWTNLVDDEVTTGGGGAPNHYFLFRRQKLTGDSTFTFVGVGDTGKGAMGWASYTNVDSTTPEEGFTSRESATSNQATITTNAATPTQSNRWALATYAMRNATDSTNTFTPDAALAERIDVTNGSGAAPWMTVEIADSAGRVTQASHSYTADNTLLTSQSASTLLYLRPSPIVLEFSGNATLSGSGTLTATGAPGYFRTATLSGSGSLVASGIPGPVAAASLSGSGTLAGTQTAVTVSGTAALGGTGTLTATTTPHFAGTATLSGSGTLVASGTLGFQGTSTLSGSGTLVASGAPRPIVTAALSGTGTLVSSGTSEVAVTATLSGTGTLAGTGAPTSSGTAALSGSGTLAAAFIPRPLAGGIGATVTNLVINPSFEVNRTGWNSAGGSFTRDDTVVYSGGWAVRLQATGALGSTVEMHQEAADRCVVTAGADYAVSAVFLGLVTGDGVYEMHVSFYDGTTFLESSSSVFGLPPTNVLTELKLNATAPTGATRMGIFVSGTSPTNASFWVDAFQVTEGATFYTYFDGSVADDPTYTYDWTGTAHASTSTRVLTAGSVPLTGNGTLTPSVGVPRVTAAAALTGTGTLEVTATALDLTTSVPLTGEGTLQAFAVDVHYAALSGLGTLLATGTPFVEQFDITVTGVLIRGHSGYLISAPSTGRLLPPGSSGTLMEPATGGGVFRTEDGVLLL